MTAPPRRLRESLILLAALGVVTALMVIVGLWTPATMTLAGVDTAGHYAWLRSPLLDGDLRFGNEYERILDPHIWEMHREPLDATGRHANPFPIGCALALLPAVAVTHLALIATPLGERWAADGFSLPYGVAAFWSLWLWACAGTLLTHAWLRRRWPPAVALLATLLGWAATGAVYYTFPIVLNNHSLALVGMPLFLLAWERWEEKPTVGRAVAAGLACGVLFLIRWQLALWPVVFWVAAARADRSRRTLWLVPLPALALALPQIAAWGVIYGQWFTLPQGDTYIQWHRPMVHLLLFSTHRGWITWTPIVAVGLAGLALGWKRDASLVTRLGIGLALQLYISAAVTDWHGAWGFGARRLIHATPLIAWGVAAVLSRLAAGRTRRLVWAALALSLLVVWNALFLAQQYRHLIPYHRALTWHEFFGDKFHLASSLERRRAVRNVEGAFELADEAREANDDARLTEALDDGRWWLARARGLDPHHEDVHLAGALLAMQHADLDWALREYQTCLDDLGVDRPQIITSMGVASLYAGRADLATRFAREALALRPGYWKAERLLRDLGDGSHDEGHSPFFF